MPKEKNIELQKHTLNLRRGDFEAMGHLFPKLGGSKAIRQVITSFVKRNSTAKGPSE
jgi:hypothetical protein